MNWNSATSKGLIANEEQRDAIAKYLQLFGDELTACQAVLFAEISQANADMQAALFQLRKIGGDDKREGQG